MRSKYGVRTDAAGKLARTVDGILFASLKEAKRYRELVLLTKAGEIFGLERQPVFTLYAKRGGAIGIYKADFRYNDKVWNIIVEDVKGFKTPLYRWKKKHVEAQYGITIREV